MKKGSCFLIYSLCLAVISTMSFTGCSNDTDDTGDPPSIDPAHSSIIFRITGENDVTFTHQAHADYYDNTCMVCHMHTDVRDDTIWSCSECHDNDDSDGLCVDDPSGHNCMYVQCQDCHSQQAPDPTPICTDCHAGAIAPPSGISFTFYGSIDTETEVDKYTFTLSARSDITLDVGSYEGDDLWWRVIPSHDPVADLELPNGSGPSNGLYNDKLKSNIFLFDASISGPPAIGFKDGTDICNCTGCHGAWPDRPGIPGCDPSGISGFYGIHNPTVTLTGLDPSDYVIAIGAQPLSAQDAWDGINTSPSPISGWAPAPNFNNYKIVVTITP